MITKIVDWTPPPAYSVDKDLKDYDKNPTSLLSIIYYLIIYSLLKRWGTDTLNTFYYHNFTIYGKGGRTNLNLTSGILMLSFGNFLSSDNISCHLMSSYDITCNISYTLLNCYDKLCVAQLILKYLASSRLSQTLSNPCFHVQ